MSLTHISLNPHYDELPEEVKNIEKHVFLQKELDYFVAKRRYIEEQIAFCLDEDLKRELLSDIQDLEEQIRYLQTIIPMDRVQDLRFVVYAYMKLYRLTFSDVAKQSGVSKNAVRDSLDCGFLTKEATQFGLWAIKTFRLDANRYIRQLYF